MMDISTIGADLLRAVAPHQSGARNKHQGLIIDEVGKILAQVLQKYEINTALRVAHFIAQACHESDGFCTTEEYASGSAYEGRTDLGNTQSGDGRLFKGRGLIQLTGRANYLAAGKRLGVDLIVNPDLAARPGISLVIACDYWASRKINPYCDQDNIIRITRLVNGGLNGIESRREYLAKAKAALAGTQAKQIAGQGVPSAHPLLHRGMESDDVSALQEALRKKGILVAVDGTFGPGTETGVRQFQTSKNIEADGIVGPHTWSELS